MGLRNTAFALALAAAATGQGGREKLIDRVGLAPGAHFVFEGATRYRMMQRKRAISDTTSKVRVATYILGVDPKRGLEAVQIVYSRDKKVARHPSLAYFALDGTTGVVTSLAPDLGRRPPVARSFVADVAWPLDWSPHVRSELFDIRQFGMQPQPLEIAVRYSCEPALGPGRQRLVVVRKDSDEPIELRARQGTARVEEHSRSYRVQVEPPRILEMRSKSVVSVFGTSQVREQELRFVSRGKTSEGGSRWLRGFASALRESQSAPRTAKRKLDALRAQATDDALDGQSVLTRLLERQIRAKLEELRATEAWQRTVDGLVGKPAPDFTLASLAGADVALRSLRGRLVLLTFWGVG